MPEFGVFTTVFFYSSLIIFLPIATFFSIKVLLFDGLIGASAVTANVWSAIAAVVTLHIALGLFIMKAYSDPSKAKLEKKDDKVD